MKVADLRVAVDRALDLTEALLGAEIALPGDFYWHLPIDAAFDMDRQPADFTVGQLADDLAEVMDDSERVPLEAWHVLSHVIGLLRALESATLP